MNELYVSLSSRLASSDSSSEGPWQRRAAARDWKVRARRPWLEVEPRLPLSALLGMKPGQRQLIADRAVAPKRKRDVPKRSNPRNDPNRPLTGVFYTRSPARPNPLGSASRNGAREIDGRHA